MSRFIRENGGCLEVSENVIKLENLASTSKCAVDVENTDIDNLIAQTHICEIELSHVIRTEDVIHNPNELSGEVKAFSRKISKEFMETVLDPFCKSIIEFVDKHPEYMIKNMVLDSRVESGKSVAMREMKKVLFSL